MLFARIVAIIAAVAVVPATAEVTENGVDLRQLGEGNFKASTAKGLWFVEHFSPRCGHCRQFAPTWEKLVSNHKHLERIAGFHMAQVNCLAQGDLCGANNIRGYPQLNLYADGKFVKEFKEVRDYDLLSRFIATNIDKYAEGKIGKSDDGEEQDEPLKTFNRPNKHGKVVEVDSTGLAKLKSDGPVFVDFFAPWCSHCKQLRPIYEKLAAAMQGVVNIVAVNCDDNSGLCKEEKVRAFPTIKLFQDGKEEVFDEYRTLEKMSAFLNARIARREMVSIKHSDFDNILAADDEFFLYLTNWDTSVEEIEQAKTTLLAEGSNLPMYMSSDPTFYSNLSIANPAPTSVLLSFSSHDPKFISSLPFPTEQDKLKRFIKDNKQPTLLELTTDSYSTIMKNDNRALAVVGAVREGPEGATDRATMLKIARAWKRGGRPFSQPVWFVIVPATQWEKWLSKMVGILPEDVPIATVIDTATREFYDITIEGHRAGLNGVDIFSVLEGVFQHFLKPKKIESGLEWGARSATLSLVTAGRWSMENPLSATLVVVVGVFLFILLLSKCMSRGNHGAGGGYMNEKGERLD